jgi:hypothetical protein
MSIEELAHVAAKFTGYRGEIRFDSGELDGALCKWMGSKILNKMGWEQKIDLRVPIKKRLLKQAFRY